MGDRVMGFPSVTRNTLQLGCSRRYSVADVVINGEGVCGTTRVDSHCAGYILYRIIIYTHTCAMSLESARSRAAVIPTFARAL